MTTRRNFFQILGAVVGGLAIGRRALPAPGAAPAVLPAVVPPVLVPRGMIVRAYVKTNKWHAFRFCEWLADGSYTEDGVVMPERIRCPVRIRKSDRELETIEGDTALNKEIAAEVVFTDFYALMEGE